MKILDAYTTRAPDAQGILDIFAGEWSSSLPAHSKLITAPGVAPLFEDHRIEWAATTLGGLAEKNCLELGPLEGGHSYMMQRMGARKVTAIEANSRAFLKCLCIKEIFALPNVEFRYGDFRMFLEANVERYDVVIASGVLYHLLEPLRFIRQISRISNQLFVWTHYYDAEIINRRPELRSKFKKLETIESEGVRCQWIEQSYGNALNWSGFCGGTAPTSRWLTRSSIIDYVTASGYNRIDVNFEAPDHPNGPSFAFCAQRV